MDRVLLGKNLTMEYEYGYREEFTPTGSGTSSFEMYDPGVGDASSLTNYGPGFLSWTTGAKFKRSGTDTLLYTGNYGGLIFSTPAFVDPQSVPWGSAPSSDAINPNLYPIVEMRLRRLQTSGNYPADAAGGFKCFFVAKNQNQTGFSTGSPTFYVQWNWPVHLSSVDDDYSTYNSTSVNWKTVFPDSEVAAGPSDYKILRWDMDKNSNITKNWNALGNNSRVIVVRFDFHTSGATGSGWVPESEPMWEIDYVGARAREYLNFSKYFYRSGKTGLFISKPGANVMSCSDGDLIFDSSADAYMQTLQTGFVNVPPAPDRNTPKTVAVHTGVRTPGNTGTAVVHWNVMLPSSNVHDKFFSSSYGTASSECQVVTNNPFVNLDYINLEGPLKTGLVPGFGLSARTSANTDNHPGSANTIDIYFTNGSPNKNQLLAWTLFKERGDT